MESVVMCTFWFTFATMDFGYVVNAGADKILLERFKAALQAMPSKWITTY